MDIRFVSSLTSEDEKLFAPALLKAVAALLDLECRGLFHLDSITKGVLLYLLRGFGVNGKTARPRLVSPYYS